MSSFGTRHRFVTGDSRELSEVPDQSVHLVVTSPPYPMIAMWDALFAELSPGIAAALSDGSVGEAFEAMHAELDRVWTECHRTLVPGGIACINIGDATRTEAEDFRLFSNHARVILGMQRIGFTPLPDILWRKPTNAPNKFMGSGMLPAGAYVTYEHEYILIFRKGSKRRFETAAQKAGRRRSAFFWEERNVWFSDVWSGLVGARQDLRERDARDRSAAFPFELPYRLIQMHSVFGDVVLDPFAGTGTTMAAALASGRDSIGVEKDPAFEPALASMLERGAEAGNRLAVARLDAHQEFVHAREASGNECRHRNRAYGFPVVTSQEVDLELCRTTGVTRSGDGSFAASHATMDLEPGLFTNSRGQSAF
jgi:DNA modification methylase